MGSQQLVDFSLGLQIAGRATAARLQLARQSLTPPKDLENELRGKRQ
jgi:hypothetical protein